jgi:hypothetical protein
VTFSERTAVVRPKGVLTERARAEACRCVAHSVAQVAADLGVGWPTVMRAVTEFGQRTLDAAWVDRAVVRQVQVETTADLVGCPSCSAVAVLHDRWLRLVRDLPAGGRPVLLCWSKRVRPRPPRAPGTPATPTSASPCPDRACVPHRQWAASYPRSPPGASASVLLVEHES